MAKQSESKNDSHFPASSGRGEETGPLRQRYRLATGEKVDGQSLKINETPASSESTVGNARKNY